MKGRAFGSVILPNIVLGSRTIKLTFSITKSSVMEYILSMCFLSFYLPNQESVSAGLFKLWRYACLMTIVLAAVMYFLKGLQWINRRYILLISFFFYIYVATAFLSPNGNISKFSFIYMAGFITLLETSFQAFDRKIVVRSYLRAGILASIIYFYTFIKYFNVDGGMHSGTVVDSGYGYITTHQNWYIFTYDNASVFIFLPIAALFLYYCYNYNRKAIKGYILYVGFILLMYISKVAATAMIAFLLCVGLMGYYYYKFCQNERCCGKQKFRIEVTYFKALLFTLVFYVLIISFVGSDICYKIAGYFGKDGTFTGRDVIWARSKEYILTYPIFGNGMETEVLRYSKIMMGQCHNILLEILYDGGMIGGCLFVSALYQFKPKVKSAFSSYIFCSCLLCYAIAAGFDAKLGFPYLIALFYFIYYLTDRPQYVSYFRKDIKKAT